MSYRSDIKTAWERVHAVPSRTFEASLGPVEYVLEGEGPPLLMSHGIQGSHVEGINMVGTYVGTGWMGIAPSRFGYFGSALPNHATPALQADVYVELLDHLGVDRAVAMGYSAGGTSVIELALRHPDRLRALVLTASALPPSSRPPVVLAPLFSAITRTERIFWALKAYTPGVMRGLMGVPKRYEPTPAEAETIRAVGESIFPVTARRQGFIFDAFTGNTWVRRCHLEDIAVPTLIVHAADDNFAPYQHAVAAADRIPGVEFVTIDKGGHLFLGREAAVRQAVTGFLGRQLQPKQAVPLGGG